MIEMHSKYDNMHKNGMFYALICINNHIIVCINCVLSSTHLLLHDQPYFSYELDQIVLLFLDN